jgi:hypothetical protein
MNELTYGERDGDYLVGKKMCVRHFTKMTNKYYYSLVFSPLKETTSGKPMGSRFYSKKM